jgi:hypothetical protein
MDKFEVKYLYNNTEKVYEYVNMTSVKSYMWNTMKEIRNIPS